MLEKDFQTKFNKWSKHNITKTAVFELKISHGISLPFDVVQEHQKFALYNAKHNKIIHKIPDAGFQNPFDSFLISKSDAYVVILFYNQRNKKEFHMIDIDVWLKEEKNSKRKSLTEERAKEIGITCFLK